MSPPYLSATLESKIPSISSHKFNFKCTSLHHEALGSAAPSLSSSLATLCRPLLLPVSCRYRALLPQPFCARYQPVNTALCLLLNFLVLHISWLSWVVDHPPSWRHVLSLSWSHSVLYDGCLPGICRISLLCSLSLRLFPVCTKAAAFFERYNWYFPKTSGFLVCGSVHASHASGIVVLRSVWLFVASSNFFISILRTKAHLLQRLSTRSSCCSRMLSYVMQDSTFSNDQWSSLPTLQSSNSRRLCLSLMATLFSLSRHHGL